MKANWNKIRAGIEKRALARGIVLHLNDVHGVNCEKAEHKASSGYLHAEGYDGPYDVDGVMYCGRCHHAFPRESDNYDGAPDECR